jgi:hypothetical protein
MKKILLAILLALALPLVSMAQEICKRHAEPKGGFSFCPPEGWTIKEDSNLAYKILLGPREADFTPNVTVSELANFPLSVKEMVAIFAKQPPEEMAKRTGASQAGPLNQSDFITTSKERGIKLVVPLVNNGLHIRSTMYFFAGKGDNKLLVNFTALETQAQVLDSVFDRSMKSWQLDRLPQ